MMAKDCELCGNDRKVKISFCPKCKSTNVKYVFEVRNLFGVMPKMRCGKCGCEMPSFPILVSDKKNKSKLGRASQVPSLRAKK